ncbi:hypothetical protein [Micromonospora endolithica]|uniref:Uncharacterized protein n=1 Tax=Micromonospora endolithica TaxID=230091 RepID=A0A3A9YYL3_9ACTN|nr:hypothetical protein [Micromonospora endolithica]RKN41083.1 hypothetical protein D7223_25410 [Micromonospora endolithica]
MPSATATDPTDLRHASDVPAGESARARAEVTTSPDAHDVWVGEGGSTAPIARRIAAPAAVRQILADPDHPAAPTSTA